MARTSRKDGKPRQVKEDCLWPAAYYARCSHESDDTCEHQLEVVRAFGRQQRELKEVAVFSDNGFTGTNFERPAFQKMLDAVRRGEIKCVVVKDLSRLGRNYIEVGNFLEKICPFLGLRVMTVTERFDSERQTGGLFSASLFNVINDLYAKDISKKTSSALKAKRLRGEYVGSYAPHGYQKDPENRSHLVVDPVTAPVIRQMFEWRANGDSYGSIMRRLNERDIPSPGRYRYENGIRTNNNRKGKELLWNRHVVTDILHNMVYIGHLAQGKTISRYCNGIAERRVPPSEWDVVYHTHEAIVSDTLFERVQAVNREQRAAFEKHRDANRHLPKRRSPYGKKLVCAECGAVMRLHRNIANTKDKVWFAYTCPTHAAHGAQICSRENIRQEELDQAVLQTIQMQIRLFLEMDRMLETLRMLRQGEKFRKAPKNEIQTLEKRLKRKKNLLASLYTDFKDGLLSEEEYAYSRTAYMREIRELEEALCRSTTPCKELDEIIEEGERCMALVKKYQKAEKLDAALVNALIAGISVHLDGSLDIQFRYQDMFDGVLAKCRQFLEVGA